MKGRIFQHMKFFLDTIDTKAIAYYHELGLVDGVTTNPTLVAQSQKSFPALIQEICTIIPGPVSAEVTVTDSKAMIEQGKTLAGLAPNVVVKLPLTPEGLRACSALTQQNIQTNVTLCFSLSQAILAAKAGATYVSPFIGRLDDIGQDGMMLIADILTAFSHYSYSTQVLVASVRHPLHVKQAAELGADVVTMPPDVMNKLFAHPLTENGLDKFIKDWEKTGQSF